MPSILAKDMACDSREIKDIEFIYVYKTLFKDLGVRLLFIEFEHGVLIQMNIAPTHLHPNSWAFATILRY